MQKYLEMVSTDESSGLIPKALNYIFEQLGPSPNLTISFIQVYNEKVYDLLNSEQIHRQL